MDEHALLRHQLQDTGEEATTKMNEATVTPGHTTATREMIVAVAAELDDRMKTMIAAAVSKTGRESRGDIDDRDSGGTMGRVNAMAVERTTKQQRRR